MWASVTLVAEWGLLRFFRGEKVLNTRGPDTDVGPSTAFASLRLSESAAQAAVESKHPRSACYAITVDTFSATVSCKKLAKRGALPSYVGSFDSVRLRLSTLRKTVEEKSQTLSG